MTTEDDFQRALDANPEDHNTRLVFADWLDERNDPRAAGYRALGRLQLWPLRMTERSWWSSPGGGVPTHNHLPRDWFAAVAGYKFAPETWRWPDTFENDNNTRREIEDAAALAFAKLPLKRQTQLLAAKPDANTPKRRKARKAAPKKKRKPIRKPAAKKRKPKRKK